MVKHCPHCDQTKPLDAFAKRTEATDGRQSWCRQCMTSYHRQWRDQVRADPPTSPRRASLERHYAEFKARW